MDRESKRLLSMATPQVTIVIAAVTLVCRGLWWLNLQPVAHSSSVILKGQHFRGDLGCKMISNLKLKRYSRPTMSKA